jgi:hypothetical protein
MCEPDAEPVLPSATPGQDVRYRNDAGFSTHNSLRKLCTFLRPIELSVPLSMRFFGKPDVDPLREVLANPVRMGAFLGCRYT